MKENQEPNKIIAQNKELYKTVSKVKLSDILPQYSFPEGEEYAVIDEDKNILNFCSGVYSLIENEKLYLPIEKMIHKQIDKPFEKKVTIINKSKFYVDYIFKTINSDIDNKRKVGDVFPKLSVWNSYDGKLKFRKEFGFYRTVCSNGLSVPFGNKIKTVSKHTMEKNKKETLQELLSVNTGEVNQFVNECVSETKEFLEQANNYYERFDVWNQINVNAKDLQNIAKETNLSKKIIEISLERYKKETENNINYVDFENNNKTLDRQERTLFLVYNALNYGIYNTNFKEHPEKKLEKDLKVIDYINTKWKLS